MPLFCVQGNIGAGKSVFLEALKKRSAGVLIFNENVDAWAPWLERFYDHPSGPAAVALQLAVVSHYQNISLDMLAALQRDPDALIITERSPEAVVKVFLEANKENHEAIGDFKRILEAIFSDTSTDIGALWRSATNVYLDVSPETCLERVERRARESEMGKSSMSLDYLVYLDELHKRIECAVILGERGSDKTPDQLAEDFLAEID